ncbi:hypothetical protein M422DRAFT_166157, partial [Sphaerobolus stellatus SS14]
IGAQVMLIKNLVQGKLVNGSIGQVVAFKSIREAHGQHTEIAEVDKSKDPRAAKDKDTESAEQKAKRSSNNVWPVVRFLNGHELLLPPAEFEIMNVHGEMEARRDQV